MKAKFLWVSLLLFAGLTACTDDVIESQSGNGPAGEGTPAYLTISFTANGGNSTRAASDVNEGDDHGNADDSGHHSGGTEDETKVTSALVVVSPTENGSFGFAKVYAMNGTDDFKMVDKNSQTYSNAEPIEVATGTYDVLVVINPIKELTQDLANGVTTNNVEQVKALYDKITTGRYKYTGNNDNYTNAANSIGMGEGYTGSDTDTNPQFLMANKAKETVTVEETNTEENPAQAFVTVERVLSKINFRETNNNIYPVTVAAGVTPLIKEGAKYNGGTDHTYGEADLLTLNQARDRIEEVVYAEYNEDNELVAVYKPVLDEDGNEKKVEINGQEYTLYKPCEAVLYGEYNQTEDKSEVYVVENTDDPKVELEVEESGEEKTWYVRLEGYALINLSKEVNYVRHTIVGETAQPFGELSNSNFLYTPYWEEKNGIDVAEDDFAVDSKWFYNQLRDVSAESRTLTVEGNKINWDEKDYFKSFETLIEDESEVTGAAGEHSDKVGKLMSYCFENSTDTEHQVHGLSTGVAFVARIFGDENCTEGIDELYLFNGHNFTSLQQIKEAYGNATPQAILEMIDGTTEPTPENLEAAGVVRYEDNICYYYTTEIKHFDNGQNEVLGPNEFIIMRNNIYSLAVTDIKELGSPFVDPTPNTPDESMKTAMDVTVTIDPWIVRYNDIEFK